MPSDPYVSYASFTAAAADIVFGPPDTLVWDDVSYSPTTHTKVWGTNLTLDWKLSDSLALKSITAYREFDSRWVEDNDVSPPAGSLGAEHHVQPFVQPGAAPERQGRRPLDYTVGGYYFDQETTYHDASVSCTVRGATTLRVPRQRSGLRPRAMPASSTASGTSPTRLNLNAGVRYTKEEEGLHLQPPEHRGTPHRCLGALNGAVGPYEGSKVDYRLNLDYRWNER